jgi:uncharacterized membrane protein YebE (DUF533 family)
MDPQRLLEQFLGSGNAAANAPQRRDGGQWDNARNMADQFTSGPMGGFGGGMAAGGLLGLLIGNKKMRNMAGGIAGYGGAAVLGALAYRAYQNWQEGKSPAQATKASERDVAPGESFLPPTAADGRPFALVVVLAMVSAAKSDGHIGPDEQKVIFDKVNSSGLEAESKAFVFDALARPIALSEVAGLVRGLEQGAEVYLAARLAVDPDHPGEKAYLEALAHRLELPKDLVLHLERQAMALPAPGEPQPG